MKNILRRYATLLPAVLVLIPHARLYDFVSDDAYISFRYARNLALHGQLVFNLGERVEGFTNFLWTLLLALGIKLGVGPVTASRFMGVAFAVGTLAVLVRASLRLSGERPSPWPALAPLLLAGSGAFACWCTGGLETQLFTFLVTLGGELLLREIERGCGVGSAIAFALAAMTRPEGAMFFGLAVAFRVLTRHIRMRRWRPRLPEVAWVALFLLLFVPYFLWRWRYYGYLFPNTFYVKSSGGAGTWQLGAYYLRRFTEDHGLPFLVLLAFFAGTAVGDSRRADLRRLVLLFWLVFAVYVIKVGGDFMGLYRFVLPVLPLGALVLQESVRRWCARLRPRVSLMALALAGLAAALSFGLGAFHTSRTALHSFGADNGIDSPTYLKRYAEERIPVGRWLGQHRRPDDLMTVGGAGVIPYYSEIPAYDVFGLVDKTIAHDPRMTVGNRPGHEKWGSDGYMLSRHPTLITHLYCLGTSCGLEHGPALPGYEWVRAEVSSGPPRYYTFLKRRDRAFGPFPAHP